MRAPGWLADAHAPKLLMDRGGAPVSPGLIRQLINRVKQTREVRLTNPVPLRVQA